jgi:hypothetical protein
VFYIFVYRGRVGGIKLERKFSPAQIFAMASTYVYFVFFREGGREAGKDEIVQRSVFSEKERDVDTLFYMIIIVIFENISNITQDDIHARCVHSQGFDFPTRKAMT